jgi:hypothetical protein
MALTSAQKTTAAGSLAGVKAAFNAAVIPVAATLNALPKNDILDRAIAAWNNIVTVMDAGNRGDSRRSRRPTPWCRAISRRRRPCSSLT